MRVLLLWWVYIVSVGVFSASLSKSETISIGAIIVRKSVNGKVSEIALNAAVNDVNSDPTILGGRKLSLSIHDSNYNGFLSIVGALQYMETDTVAIIGPQGSTMAHIISHLANELHVPLLSFTASDPTLTPLQYPYFIQTAPNDMFEMAAIAEVIGYFGWREVTAVFSDDEQSRNDIAALADKLAERRSKVSYKAILPPDTIGTREEIEEALAKVKLVESRVIVLSTYATTGRLVFEVAESLGMMTSGYVWITTYWLSTLLDSVQISPEFAKSIDGVITFRPHVPDSDTKTAFSSRWNQLSNGTIGLNPFALYAYDTVWIIANALKAFFDHGGTISFSNNSNLSPIVGQSLNLGALSTFDGGEKLLKNILETKMTGLTGPIQFDSNRLPLRAAYDIINVARGGFRNIGFWSNYSGLSIVSPEVLYRKPANRSTSNQHLHRVTWPGETTQPPRGWIFANNGSPLRIGVPKRVSFKNFVQQVEGSNEIEGYSIDVFKAAVKLLSYQVPYEFVLFGDGIENPSYNELVRMVAADILDAAVGDIAIVTNRTKIVDFTQPYIESGLVVVAPVRKQNSSAWSFLTPFTPCMWGVTAAFFLLVGAVIWILEHRNNDEFRGPPKKQIITIFWFSFSTMFFSHRENTVSTLGRMVLLIWLFVVLILTSSYTASLTSILTLQQLSSPIEGIDSLLNTNQMIGYQIGSFAENYLLEELNIPRNRLVALGSPEAYAEALSNGTVAAIVDERPYVDAFLADRCQFSIRGREFTKSGWGFVFPRDSPLATDLSTAILKLSENGDLQRINNQRITKSSCAKNALTQVDQLQIKSFWGLFLICGVACSLALCIYFFRVLRQFLKHYADDPDPSTRSRSKSARIQTFLSFVDDKKDVSVSKLKRKRAEMSQVGNREDPSPSEEHMQV
uniref:Glutamate receptor n=1 Tax=Kalanchoe fedtschenkoi TaxID=63787 RepID=A0A7N0U5J8_KALFE